MTSIGTWLLQFTDGENKKCWWDVSPGKLSYTFVERWGERKPYLSLSNLEFIFHQADRRRGRGLWLKCHRIFLILLTYIRFSWINVFNLFSVYVYNNFQILCLYFCFGLIVCFSFIFNKISGYAYLIGAWVCQTPYAAIMDIKSLYLLISFLLIHFYHIFQNYWFVTYWRKETNILRLIWEALKTLLCD